MWIEILKRHVAAKGLGQVAHELGISKSTVSLVCNDKYPGSAEKIVERIRKIYGQDGNIVCAILGPISPAKCADTWNRARRIGMKAGNPETLRLYKSCLSCAVRRRA